MEEPKAGARTLLYFSTPSRSVGRNKLQDTIFSIIPEKKQQNIMASSWRSFMGCSCPDTGGGCREACMRSVRGCQAMDTASSRQLQGSHSRVQLSPTAMTAVPQGKHLFRKSKTLPVSNEWGRTRVWETALRTQRQEQERRSRSSEQRHPVGP